jgi:hypothetical protein
VFDSIDYQLRWPRAMFEREANALLELRLADNRGWWARAEQLVKAAFAGDRAAEDLRATKPVAGPVRQHLGTIELTDRLLARQAALTSS